MPATTDLGTIRLYGEIVRRDDEARIVEGYAFVNEDVGDGLSITRVAMEEATPDFMKWANVRQMHQPIPIGTVERLAWDEKGCHVRVKVVDENAWKLVVEGVLKGFSVGVKPLTVRRGKKAGDYIVTKGRWRELSMVDRPKDDDSPFVIARADDGGDTTQPVIEEESTEPTMAGIFRGVLMESLKKAEPMTLIDSALSKLSSLMWSIRYGDFPIPDGMTLRMAFSEAMNDCRDYMAPLVDKLEVKVNRADMGNHLPLDEMMEAFLTRADYDAQVIRADEATKEREALRAEADELRVKVTKYETQPDPEQKRPIKGELDDDMVLRMAEKIKEKKVADAEDDAKTTRIGELMRTDWSTKTEAEKQDGMRELQRLRGGVA